MSALLKWLTGSVPAAGTTVMSNGTSWGQEPSFTEVTHANLPAPSAARVGKTYHTSDTNCWVFYDSATTSRVFWPSGTGKADWGPFAASTVIKAASMLGLGPAMSTGNSGCIYLYPTAEPSGVEIIFSHEDSAGTTRGWQLRNSGDLADKCAMRFQLRGYTAGEGGFQVTCSAATFDDATNTTHGFAWKHTATPSIIYSWDGGAATEVSIWRGGTYVPCNVGDQVTFGAHPNTTTSPFTSGRIIAVKTWSSLLSDANLVTLSGAHATSRIPDIGGATVDYQLNAEQLPGGWVSGWYSGEWHQVTSAALRKNYR